MSPMYGRCWSTANEHFVVVVAVAVVFFFLC